MTRCCCCNKNLNDEESTRKDSHGQYKDMCTKCDKLIDDVHMASDEDDVMPIMEDNYDHEDILNMSLDDLQSLDYNDDKG